MALMKSILVVVLVAITCWSGLSYGRDTDVEFKEVNSIPQVEAEGKTFVELKQDCGGELAVDRSGTTFTSPGYLNNIMTHGNESCTWIIKAQNPDDTLELQCDHFYIRKSCGCRADRLVIFEGGVEQTKFCGNGAKFYNSSGNDMEVRFRTNSRHSNKGFSCTIRSVGSPRDCVCGFSNANKRLIGGQEISVKNKYPWHVGIITSDDLIYECGGSIINERYILTSAFCANRVRSVAVGDHNMYSTDDDVIGVTQLVDVDRIIVHPEAYQYNSNIALIRLVKHLDLSKDELGAVCLPDDVSKTYEGEVATVAGWGMLAGFDYSYPATLREISLNILDPSCPGARLKIPEHSFCAFSSGKEVCNHDNGGALMVKEGLQYVAVGVAYYTFPTFGCHGLSPSQFTRVSDLIDWIKNNTADTTACSRSLPS